MRFAQVSDLHLCRHPDRIEALRDDTPAIVAALARDLRRIAGILDCVIVAGDLTDDAHDESFAQFEEMFAGIGVPVFTIPGNHDGPAAYHDRKTRSAFLRGADIAGRIVQVGGVRLLGIDTCLEGMTTGAVSEQALDTVAGALDAPQDGPLVIVMHHPPFVPGQRVYDEISVIEGAARFAALLEGAAHKPTILCGHIHRPYTALVHGTLCLAAGTPVAPFAAPLPFGDGDIAPSDEAYAYLVHQVGADGAHVLTTRSVPPGASGARDAG
ncbi:metallophosphoesterase family protein [Maliponia aquimaris]|uniref:3',5'-cyclic adenosine monophosphate phosphodiesterase CpdA n=1 Tax=Maliponia aquimaris TaxID=1673631 RepID=A0A238KMY3_9RHOB|nr:metallophosphoesterase [Maliponia aquimaris]SMX44021.1 3',5'-cyclic adenosine monophosphate phosphodiesterase CpdA [Maliponia aquimaris]